jgi:hypothetical protein
MVTILPRKISQRPRHDGQTYSARQAAKAKSQQRNPKSNVQLFHRYLFNGRAAMLLSRLILNAGPIAAQIVRYDTLIKGGHAIYR